MLSKKFSLFSQLSLLFSIFEIRIASIAVNDIVRLASISLKNVSYFSLTIKNCAF